MAKTRLLDKDEFLSTARSTARLILLDLDGTLVEFPSSALYANLSRILEGLGVEMCDYDAFLGHLSVCDPLRFIPDDFKELVAPEFWDFMNRPDAPALPLIPGALEALSRVKSLGIQVGIVTARKSLSAATREYLNTSEVSRFLDLIVTRPQDEVVWRGKSLLIRKVCEGLNLPTSSVCFIGDIPHDIVSGREAEVGLMVGVQSGGVKFDLLVDAGADAVFESIAVLAEL